MIDISDSMIFLKVMPNVIGLYLPMQVVRREVRQYRATRDSGEIRKHRGAHPEPAGPMR